jgi:predicted metal-binding membrane protein
MDAGPGTQLGSLGFYVGIWVVMMAAMMFPSIWPMVVAYAGIQSRRRKHGKTKSATVPVALFVGGYLAASTAFGLAAYGVFELGRSLSIDALAWDSAGPYVAYFNFLLDRTPKEQPDEPLDYRKDEYPD